MKLTKEQRIAAGNMLAAALGNTPFISYEDLIAKLEEILQYDQPAIDQEVAQFVERIRPRLRKRALDEWSTAHTSVSFANTLDDELTKCLAPQEKTLARKMADYLRDNGDKSCEKQACDLAAIAHKESEKENHV